MIYVPRNSRYNREANLLEKTTWLIEKKNGLAFFVVISKGEENMFCSCEENLFEKEFSKEPGINLPSEIKIPGMQSEVFKNIKFKRYPVDLKIKPEK